MSWGLIIEPRKRYTQHVEQSFHMSMASLDISISDDKPVQVMLVAQQTSFLLCTLQKKTMWQVPLDLNIPKGSMITLTCNGRGYVHLTGYVISDHVLSHEKWLNDLVKEFLKIEQIGRNWLKDSIDYLKNNKSMQTKGNWTVQQLKPSEKEASPENKRKRETVSSKDMATKRMRALPSAVDGNDDELTTSHFYNDAGISNTDNSNEKDKNGNDEMQEGEDGKSEEKNDKAQKKNKKIKLKKSNGQQKDKEKKNERQQLSISKNNEYRKVVEGDVVVEELKIGTGELAEQGKCPTIYYLARCKIGDKLLKIDKCLQGPGLKFCLGEGHVLRGVQVGVKGMRVGGKRRLTIPPEMGYGAKGSLPQVPPHSTLVYDIELIKVEVDDEFDKYDSDDSDLSDEFVETDESDESVDFYG